MVGFVRMRLASKSKSGGESCTLVGRANNVFLRFTVFSPHSYKKSYEICDDTYCASMLIFAKNYVGHYEKIVHFPNYCLCFGK